MALVGAGELELIRDLDILLGKLLTYTISVGDVAHSGGEGPLGALDELLLDGVNKTLVVLAILISRHKWVQTTLHVGAEEVPRVSLLEAWHSKEVLGLFSVDEELEGEGWKQTFRELMKVHSL